MLQHHPDQPPRAIRSVGARITAVDPHWTSLRWRIEGAGSLILPPFAGRARTDGLWRETCFELFVSAGHGAYAEFNFSPSERWAAYDFTSYRDGMADRPMPRQPAITPRRGRDVLIVDVALPSAVLPPLPAAAALTAVLVEEGGVTSYWAPAHAPGKPDFHAEACRTLVLAAPQAS